MYYQSTMISDLNIVLKVAIILKKGKSSFPFSAVDF